VSAMALHSQTMHSIVGKIMLLLNELTSPD
jgi:hypothetical protein